MNYTNWFLLLSIISLLYIVFYLIHSLTASDFIYFCNDCLKNNGLKENFENQTVTVDLPINTRYSCQNFCSPTARCAITGQQCFTDFDCPGCQEKKDDEENEPTPVNVPGDNDAGKLTIGVTPQYSPLTSGFGTHQLMLEHENQPAQADFGVNTWETDYKETKQLFDRRYKPDNLEFMPDYPNIYSLTGDFDSDGPFPANY